VVVVVVVSSPTSGRISDETTAAGDGGGGCKTRGIALSYRFAHESDEAPPIVCRRCRRTFFVSRSLSRTHHPKHHTHTKNPPFYQRRRPLLGCHNLVKKKGEQMTRVGGHSSSQKLLLLLAILAFRVLCDLRKARRSHQSSKEQQSHDATTSKHKVGTHFLMLSPTATPSSFSRGRRRRTNFSRLFCLILRAPQQHYSSMHESIICQVLFLLLLGCRSLQLLAFVETFD
jgi:hypothetical protein